MIDAIGWILIGLGLAFDLFGCLGLVRLPDLYNRLQAATKCVTLGTCSILAGVLAIKGFSGTGLKAIVCIAFVLLTSPVAAHALARAGRRAGIPLWSKSVVDKYAEDFPRGATTPAPNQTKGVAQ